MLQAAIRLGTTGEGSTVDLDVQKLVDTRLLIQANSGGGKSWALRRILEQTHGRLQHLVIDPEGEFSSLRERFDYVLAARGAGDTVADPRYARLLAERLLELNVSAILDIYELKAHERVAFVKNFIEALVDAPKTLWHPALVVVDEAHVYCPEKDKAESAGAVKDLATRGRKRKFCVVLATQRLAKLAKDAAAECNNKLIGRTGLDVDMARAGDELGFAPSRRLELRELAAGQFYAFGPAISREVVRVSVGPVLTTHPSTSGRLSFTPPPPTEKVRALLPKLSDLPAEAEQRRKTVDDLRKEVVSLQAQLRARPKDMPASEPERKEVPVLKDGQILRLEQAIGHQERLLATFGETLHKAQQDLEAKLIAFRHEALPIKEGLTAIRGEVRHEVEAPRGGAGREAVAGAMRTITRPAPIRRLDSSLSSVEQRVLDALAELGVLGVPRPERVQVAFLSGYSNLDSKGFKNAMGSLHTAGLIVYPTPGNVALTESGALKANAPERPRTPGELQDRIIGLLGGVHGRVLQPLIQAYPESVAREEVARQAGYGNLDSKGFKNAMGRLRSLGLIDYPNAGQVQAQRVLFLEGAA